MPVRFRCRHCHQLLGIARRKIGTEVHCPTCHNPVTVPATDAPDVDEPAVRKPDPLFEGSDLDALLRPSAFDPTAAAPVKPAVIPPPIDVEPYNPPAPPPAAPPAGMVLSSFQATLLTVGAVLLLAVFFTAGLLIGRFWF